MKSELFQKIDSLIQAFVACLVTYINWAIEAGVTTYTAAINKKGVKFTYTIQVSLKKILITEEVAGRTQCWQLCFCRDEAGNLYLDWSRCNNHVIILILLDLFPNWLVFVKNAWNEHCKRKQEAALELIEELAADLVALPKDASQCHCESISSCCMEGEEKISQEDYEQNVVKGFGAALEAALNRAQKDGVVRAK